MPDSTPPPEPSGLDRTNKMCRACGAAFAGPTHEGCPAAPPASQQGTIVLSSDSQPPPPPTGAASQTPTETLTKTCPACGGKFSGEYHTDCPSSGSRGGGKPPSSKSSLDAIPSEAQAMADDPSQQLNQYILVKQIGRGGMGAVYKAWDRKLTRWVAIKFLLVGEEEDVARFQREAKLAARLRHPNIAPIYEVGESTPKQAGESTRHYLAMEYIDGTSLAEVKRPVPEMLDLFLKVAQGIEAAHKAAVIHRDLKPANIMLTADGWPYVMDFGLAKAHQSESSISVSGAVMGTPAYMPPEQAQGQLDDIDGRTDVYSLGATMYTVFTGRQPFKGQSAMDILMKVVQEEPPTPKSINEELPDEVDVIIRKAMAKRQDDRYQSAQELADDIQRFLGDQQIAARPPTIRQAAAPTPKGSPWGLIAAVLVLGAVGAAAFFFMNPQDEPDPVVVKPPPVVNPTPTPPPVDTTAQKQEEWLRGWLDVRDSLDFERWEPGDANLASRTNALLARMGAEAALRDRVNTDDWMDRQARRAEQEAAGLGQDRDRAKKIVAWSGMYLAAVKDVPSLRAQSDTVSRAKSVAAAIANYRGAFTLKLAVGPYAEVVRLMRDGKDVALKQRFTPLVISDLEIGQYVLELSHPQHGKKKVTIASDKLKEGKTYLIAGKMQDGALRVTELP